MFFVSLTPGTRGADRQSVAEAELRRMVTLAGEESLRHGITSFQDLGTTFAEVDLLKAMADEGNLPVRLYMAFEEQAADMADRLDDYRMIGYGNNFLTVRSIGEKVLDGALGTHGGWLLEPYSDMPRSYGLNVVSVEEIEASAQLAIEHDYQMAIQGIGDRAYRELLDIYEAAFAKHPDETDLRWRIEHAQVIHPDDVSRTVALGVIPAVQGNICLFRRALGRGAPWRGTHPRAGLHLQHTRRSRPGADQRDRPACRRDQPDRQLSLLGDTTAA